MYSDVSRMFSISISRIDFVRLRISMSTVFSLLAPPPWSIAPEPQCVVRAMCEFTQCINEQLLRWLGGRKILEQPVPRFVPIDHELMGGCSAVSSWRARRGDSSLADAPCPAVCREQAGEHDQSRFGAGHGSAPGRLGPQSGKTVP